MSGVHLRKKVDSAKEFGVYSYYFVSMTQSGRFAKVPVVVLRTHQYGYFLEFERPVPEEIVAMHPEISNPWVQPTSEYKQPQFFPEESLAKTLAFRVVNQHGDAAS